MRAAVLRPTWRDLLDALIPPSCAACDAPTTDIFCATCLETIEAAPPEEVACVAFGGAVADAVRQAKFNNDIAVARALGRFWVQRIRDGSAPALPAADGITFVPAPWRRRVKRGFDLPALLACALARHTQLPVLDALACVRVDAPLSFGADKATRAVAVAGRYRARRSVSGMHLLVVDDVRTTGATLGEAARVLAEAGASVSRAAFAVTP